MIYTENEIITPCQEEFEKMNGHIKIPESSEKKERKKRNSKKSPKSRDKTQKRPKTVLRTPKEGLWTISNLTYASGRWVATVSVAPGKPAPHVTLNQALVKTNEKKYGEEKSKYSEDLHVNSTLGTLANIPKVIASKI